MTSMAFTRLLIALSIGLLARISSSAAVHHVSVAGSPAPERDQPGRPWHLVKAAAAALPPAGGTVSIQPGVYRETFSIVNPAVLEAPSGAVTIGAVGIAASTTFTVLSWNTHLYGDDLSLPSGIPGFPNLHWQDYERADFIGSYFAGRILKPDMVALSEIWDEDLFVGGDGANGIRPQSGYSSWMNFPETKSGAVFACGLLPMPAVFHSGLTMMAALPMAAMERVHYSDCSGDCPTDGSPDCLASKGFIGATIAKAGFSIRVYSTHTQAGNDPDAISARQNQLRQLGDAITAYRSANPSHPVFVMGDLNVIGETGTYNFLGDQFGNRGGFDAARNAPGAYIFDQPDASYSLLAKNELAIHFDPASSNQRLDYVWYFPSLDGKVRVQPASVQVSKPNRPAVSADGLTSDEISDHYPIEATFRLDLIP
jgi:endonuclease/exonuclease/phosphatase family metal-dependent hydrolase